VLFLSAKGRSGEVVAWLSHTTEASIPLAREKIHMTNSRLMGDSDSDLDTKKLCLRKMSDLDRGIFEVAPRFAVVHGVGKSEMNENIS
jgi:hypothetical protein